MNAQPSAALCAAVTLFILILLGSVPPAYCGNGPDVGIGLQTDLAWPDNDPILTAHASGKGHFDQKGRLVFNLNLTGGKLLLPELRSSFTGTARGRIDGLGLFLESAELKLPAPTLLTGDSPVKLPPAVVRLKSERNETSEETLRFQTSLNLDNVLQADGPVEINSEGYSARLRLKARDAGKAVALFSPGLSRNSVSGSLDGVFTFAAADDPPKAGNASASSTTWTLDGTTTVNGILSAGGATLRSPQLVLAARGGEGPGNRSWIELSEGELRTGQKNPSRFMRVTGRMETDGAGAWNLVRGNLNLKNGGSLSVQGGITSRRPLSLSARLDGAGLIRSMTTSGLLPAEADEWSPGGFFDWTAKLGPRSRKGSRSFNTKLVLRNGTFLSPDARTMGLELGAELKLTGSFEPDSPPPLSIDLRIDRGGAIFGPVLMEYSKHPFTFSGKGEPGSETKTAHIQASAHMQGLARIDLNSTRQPDGNVRTSLDLYKADLAVLVHDLLAPALGEGYLPQVNGTAELHLLSRGNIIHKKWDTVGRLTLRNGSAAQNGRSLIRDVELDLPVHLRTPRNASIDEIPEKWGSLTSGPGQYGNFSLVPLNMDVAWTPAGISTRNPIRLRFYGATLTLDALRLDDPFVKKREAELSAELDGLDLSRIPSGAIPLQGAVSSGPLYVRYGKNDLKIYGSLNGTFYGGDLDIRDIAVARPLTAGRTIETDIRIKGMNLEPLSEAMGIGRVTGKLDLDLDDFSMAYGQPAGFRLNAQSTPGDRTDKMVSLQAVNTLSVIGTGSGFTDMGVGVFTSFFKEFAYSRIGMNCTLDNDRFRIRGLMHDGNTEYLIKKPLFFGVNVVNSNPDNVISFSDMLERVRRVVRPAGTDKPGMEEQQ